MDPTNDNFSYLSHHYGNYDNPYFHNMAMNWNSTAEAIGMNPNSSVHKPDGNYRPFHPDVIPSNKDFVKKESLVWGSKEVVQIE